MNISMKTNDHRCKAVLPRMLWVGVTLCGCFLLFFAVSGFAKRIKRPDPNVIETERLIISVVKSKPGFLSVYDKRAKRKKEIVIYDAKRRWLLERDAQIAHISNLRIFGPYVEITREGGVVYLLCLDSWKVFSAE